MGGKAWILDPAREAIEFLDPCHKILDPRAKILDTSTRILDAGERIVDPRHGNENRIPIASLHARFPPGGETEILQPTAQGRQFFSTGIT